MLLVKNECMNTELAKNIDVLTGEIIGAAIEVHRTLGPGFLESSYEACFIHELQLREIKVEDQKPLMVPIKESI